MVVDRYHSLDEQPAIVREVSDYAAKLVHEPLVQAISEQRELAVKARTCGLPGLTGRGDGAAESFERILQKMIKRTLANEQEQASGLTPSVAAFVSRIRVFEDHTVPFATTDGETATFTDCRSTQFKRLRAAAGVSEDQYCASLCDRPFQGQSGQGGKSGALFLKTHDDELILKTIEEHEFDCLREILPNYLLYLEENKDSLLCRFFGAYALQIGPTTLRFVVMRNVLRGSAMQIYDLKGTTEDRWVDPDRHSVLKDNNFVGYAMEVEAKKALALRNIIRDDSEFLESCGLMDYSLLVGVAEPNSDVAGSTVVSGMLSSAQAPQVARVFQLGIIDYLQRWTPKKVAAHWLKKFTIGCTQEIDTEPPAIYCARFYKYMATKVVPAQR